MQPLKFSLFVVCCFVLSTADNSLHAHPQINEQIRLITLRIARDGPTPDLYLNRASLHRHHRDWDSALEDYDLARRLAPELPRIHFDRAVTYCAKGECHKAEAALNRFMELRPNHPEAWKLRARLHERQQQYPEAAEAYTRSIQCSSTPGVELYFARAQAFRSAGPDHLDQALQGLEDGLARIGPAIALETLALELELDQGAYWSALERVNGILQRTERKEKWLFEQGKIYLAAGQPALARQSFERALGLIEMLPRSLQNSRATRRLRLQLQDHLNPSGPSETHPAKN